MILNKESTELTDICPAKRGQSTASSVCTSSSGISWLTDSMFPGRKAWRWGNMPEQWLPSEGGKKINAELYLTIDNGVFFHTTPVAQLPKGINVQKWHKWTADVPGMTWRAPFSFSESSKASHTERTGPPAIPQYLWTQQLHLDNTNDTKKNLSVFFHTLDSLPHILMPGHIWKSILSRAAFSFAFSLLIVPGAAGFECWVFADEAGVQQDDVRAQDGSDHVQDLRVFGESHHPWILKVNIVETVLGVLLTWKQTQICNTSIHWQ